MSAIVGPLASARRRASSTAAAERSGRLVPLRVSARTDYALRAVAELAATDGRALVKAEAISQAQGIPLRFLLNILNELRHARIVRSHRGADGGYQLARPPADVTVAEIVVAMEGSVTSVQGAYPDELVYPGPARALGDLWRAVDAALTRLLVGVTVADVAEGALSIVVAEVPLAAAIDPASS
jgi:Rrf2 family protein